MAKRGRPKTSKIYFTTETQDAIVAYNESTDNREREALFTRHIYKPFYKIAENVYNKYKIMYMGDARDAMMDCIVFMFERLHMFKGEKGKAFSYFTIIARNYYFQTAGENFKTMKRNLDIDGWGDDGFELVDDLSDNDNKEFTDDFTNKIILYLKENMASIMTNETNSMIGYLSLEYFDDIDNIDDFNRKGFQKDIAIKLGLNKTKTDAMWKKAITDAHNRLNIYYYHAKTHYINTGKMPEFRKFNQISAESVKYILDKYEPNCNNRDGVIGLCKKLNIEENIITRVLNFREEYSKMYHLT